MKTTQNRHTTKEESLEILEASNKLLDNIRKKFDSNCSKTHQFLINEATNATYMIIRYQSEFTDFFLELKNIKDKFNKNYTK
jgi:hypothetical protein